MDKQYILDEIRRTAEANGGKPLGRERFERETGIRFSDWYAKHWARWGDALAEAGFVPNEMLTAYPDEYLVEKLISIVCELGHFPVTAELRLKRKRDPDFPSHTVFPRLGSMQQLRSIVASYCRAKGGYDDVIELCAGSQTSDQTSVRLGEQTLAPEIGYVYLMKMRSWRYYKIRKSNAPGRREYALSLQLPEKLETVHAIRTDDPEGMERYWHNRFRDKRKGGEWFELSAEDVRAFKRRKVM